MVFMLSQGHSEIMERHREREYGFRRNAEVTSRYAGGRFRGGNINVGNRHHHNDRDPEVQRRDERERREQHGRHERHEDRPDSRRGYTRLQFRGRFPRK